MALLAPTGAGMAIRIQAGAYHPGAENTRTYKRADCSAYGRTVREGVDVGSCVLSDDSNIVACSGGAGAHAKVTTVVIRVSPINEAANGS
jgi:hypothetical protein